MLMMNHYYSLYTFHKHSTILIISNNIFFVFFSTIITMLKQEREREENKNRISNLFIPGNRDIYKITQIVPRRIHVSKGLKRETREQGRTSSSDDVRENYARVLRDLIRPSCVTKAGSGFTLKPDLAFLTPNTLFAVYWSRVGRCTRLSLGVLLDEETHWSDKTTREKNGEEYFEVRGKEKVVTRSRVGKNRVFFILRPIEKALFKIWNLERWRRIKFDGSCKEINNRLIVWIL